MMGNDLGSGLQVADDCARSPRSQSSGGGDRRLTRADFRLCNESQTS